MKCILSLLIATATLSFAAPAMASTSIDQTVQDYVQFLDKEYGAQGVRVKANADLWDAYEELESLDLSLEGQISIDASDLKNVIVPKGLWKRLACPKPECL